MSPRTQIPDPIDGSPRDTISAAEGADILGIGVQEMHAVVRSGRLPKGVAWHIGRRVRLSKSKLIAWRDAGGG